MAAANGRLTSTRHPQPCDPVSACLSSHLGASCLPPKHVVRHDAQRQQHADQHKHLGPHVGVRVKREPQRLLHVGDGGAGGACARPDAAVQEGAVLELDLDEQVVSPIEE
jgi:hypothetical protein